MAANLFPRRTVPLALCKVPIYCYHAELPSIGMGQIPRSTSVLLRVSKEVPLAEDGTPHFPRSQEGFKASKSMNEGVSFPGPFISFQHRRHTV